jgi:VanZ family protein
VPKLKLFIPAVLWFIIIFILLMMPGDDIPKAHFFDIVYFDKWVHAGLFGMQVLLASFPFFKGQYNFRRIAVNITVGAVVYGVAMEFVQKYFTSDRAFDIWDMAADTFGAVMGCLFMVVLYKRKLRRLSL